MSLPFELRIALRYLRAGRRQAFVSLISAISVLGVAVGVMALLISLGLMTGLQSEIRSRILGATAHVSIFRSGQDTIDDYRAVAERLRRLPHVEGAAAALYAKALLSSRTGSGVATIKGVLPADELKVTELGRQVQDGTLASLRRIEGQPDPILLGRDLATSLGVGVGDVLTLTSPNGRLSPMGVLPRTAKLRVVGTVRSGLFEFDSAWAYVPLATAQRLFDTGDRAGLVQVRVDDMYAVREIAPALLEALGPGYVANDWIRMNESLFQALWLEKTAIGITIGLIVAVAALNIVATLVLMVMEKHKDIAILMAMGCTRAMVSRVFMLQGSVIGAVGTAVGATLGTAACWVLDHYRVLQVPADVYQISHVPFRLLPGDAALVVVGALAICFVATLHPARGAASLDPAEALRYS